MDKSTKKRKGIESQPISLGVEAGVEACRKKPTEKGGINIGNKFYRPPLKSTYKETKLLEDLNDSM